MGGTKFFVILILTFIYCVYECYSESNRRLEAIPERVETTYVNEKYVTNVTTTVRRKSRRGSYVFNAYGITKHTWDNNVTVDLIYHEYLHNEYKRSFFEIHTKFCDLINKDPYLGWILQQSGVKCPMPPGPNGATLMLTIPNFPYEFPFKKCMVEIFLQAEPSHEPIAKAKLYLTYKQAAVNQTNKN